jgi:restriction system protein
MLKLCVMKNSTLLPNHGGYKTLKSFQTTTLIYDLTVAFCDLYINQWRMKDQMIQAARSGRQNIAEGSQASGTSKKTEIKLVSVARASLEELLLDYQDYLRQRQLPVWAKDNVQTQQIRALAYRSNRTYKTYSTYLAQPESAANALICLIHQANYLLDRQLQALELQFKQDGGFTERLYNARFQHRFT